MFPGSKSNSNIFNNEIIQIDRFKSPIKCIWGCLNIRMVLFKLHHIQQVMMTLYQVRYQNIRAWQVPPFVKVSSMSTIASFYFYPFA